MINYCPNNPLMTDLRVATYNVHGFYGADAESAYRASSVLFEAKVDVACLQEYEKGNDSIVNSRFAFLPYGVINGEHAIYSKYPIVDSYYSKFDGSGFSYMWADINMNNTLIRVLSSHFETTGLTSSISNYKKYGSSVINWSRDNVTHNLQMRSIQMEKILSIVDTTTIPMVLCLDMNDIPSSYVYNAISRVMNDDFTSCGSGYASTYYGIFGLMRIDYIFFTDDFVGLRRNTSTTKCSDHKAVILDLQLTQHQ